MTWTCEGLERFLSVLKWTCKVGAASCEAAEDCNTAGGFCFHIQAYPTTLSCCIVALPYTFIQQY